MVLKELHQGHPGPATVWIKVIPNRATTGAEGIQHSPPGQVSEAPLGEVWLLLMPPAGFAALTILPLKAVQTNRTAYNTECHKNIMFWWGKMTRMHILHSSSSFVSQACTGVSRCSAV